MAIPPREFYKFNNNNSVQHFDMDVDSSSWIKGAETFLNVFGKGQLFDLSAYAQVKKDYEFTSEGVTILRHEVKVEVDPDMVEEDVTGETHRIETEWEIKEPKGFVEMMIDGVAARVEWGNGKITDLNGVEARLTTTFEIVEDLEVDEEERFVEINRLERLLNMTKDPELRKMLTFKVASLNYRGER